MGKNGFAVVTGGAGFIGSHLADALLAEGWRVVVIDDFSGGCEANVPCAAEVVACDVCSDKATETILKTKPRYVFHYAAQVSLPRSVAQPVEDARTNVLGAICMLRAGAQAGVDKFVFASSGGALYGETNGAAAREDWPIVPVTPYGAAKASAEQYLATFWRRYRLKYASLRLSNVFGPRQGGKEGSGLVAVSLKRMLNGDAPIIYGDGSQVRDYVYVDDVVDANLRAAAAPECGAYNIGTGIGTTVRDLLSILADASGCPVPPLHGPPREGDVQCSILDPSRAGREFGWRPRYALEEALKRTADWYRVQR